ncbi:hypothetical protein [Bartonella sp. AU55XJBT]|uniref:hypothetical protein n=1 Tax=Bartonella sp. AU55XJBT TaxID=3019091 RepID=UPI0023619CEF|nr:hypothetical protein [Bartonella sp. AU55XJBT]
MNNLMGEWCDVARALVFYATPSIFLMLGYEVMLRRGAKKGLFFKMLLFGFIFAAVTDFIYKQARIFWFSLALIGAKYLGVPWIWSLNEWGSICICVLLVRVMSAFFHEGMRCVGVTCALFLKRIGFY